MFSRVAFLCSLVSSLAWSAEISIAPGETIQIRPDQTTTVSCGGSSDGSGNSGPAIIYYSLSNCTQEVFRTSQYMSPQQCAALPARLGTNEEIRGIYRNGKCEQLFHTPKVVEACNKYAL